MYYVRKPRSNSGEYSDSRVSDSVAEEKPSEETKETHIELFYPTFVEYLELSCD